MFGSTRGFQGSKGGDEFTKSRFHNKMADVMYHINGTGRDTYIYNNNGGFAEMHVPSCKGISSG